MKNNNRSPGARRVGTTGTTYKTALASLEAIGFPEAASNADMLRTFGIGRTTLWRWCCRGLGWEGKSRSKVFHRAAVARFCTDEAVPIPTKFEPGP